MKTQKFVNDLRKKMKLSQTKFATGLNTNIGTVQDWEYGKTEPTGTAWIFLQHIDKCLSCQRDLIERSNKKGK